MKRRFAFGLYGLLAGAALSSFPFQAAGELNLERDSVYNHITVKQEGSERCMLFGRRNQQRQTCVDVNDPVKPIFEYTSMMCVGFLFNPKPQRVALLGLGGGYIPLLFQKYYPDVQLEVVEIDKVVVELAQKHFFFKPGPKLSCTIADGRQHLKRDRHRYDQIWIDAFNGDYIPAHMTTLEFLRLAKSRLAEGGIVIQNVHNTNALYDAQLATFRGAFKTVYVFTGHKSGNSVFVASDEKLREPRELLKELKSRREVRLGQIDLVAELGKYEAETGSAGGKLLTDDYSPANLLMFKARN
ncbi:MAG: fused MFS/spermidine synthase [Deltaproteobacteria bacterium]|nr:fused MFS/spermidine synthase [Deltaproteobacteria bacterium]